MQKSNSAETRHGLLLSLVVLGLAAALFVLPFQFRSEAVSQTGSQNGLVEMTSSQEPGIEYYDIRTAESKEASGIIASYRQLAGRSAVDVADIKENFVKGEQALRQNVPTLKVEYNTDIHTPSVIAPDVKQGRAVLTDAARAPRAEILRNFIKENNDLLGMSDSQASELKVTIDQTNPDGNLSFARLEQVINGIPVYQAEVTAAFNKRGEMFRVVNKLAPGLDGANISQEFGDPANAVRVAAANVNYDLKANDTVANESASSDSKVRFGGGDDWDVSAEKMYFPIEPGVARPVWRILIWKPVNAYYVLVDAETGAMLLRENITKDQTQAATYNVYANSTSMVKALDNPAPMTPGPVDPSAVTQGVLQNRTNVTLIGNEGDLSFNNLGWINDNANMGNGWTDGNNVEAGLDRVAPDGVDAPVSGTGRAFNFAYNPSPGNPTPGDEPLTPAYQAGAVTQLFYVTNRYHDELYKLGFTEQFENYQNDNFGRGGLGNDRIRAEAQDSGGTNNANFSPTADGTRGRMQMYIWTPPTPDRDGDLDAEIVIHELTHGTFGRLSNGTGGTQSGQMHEGYADWYGHALLSEATDPVNGVYVTGGYSTYLLRSAIFGGGANYYYGIRRFPKAVIAFTGGPNNRPHNPLTYADIDTAQFNVTNGAFAPAFTGTATGSHDGGEIWSSMLWEVRAKLIQRLGAVEGNRKALQLVTDGMKLNPSNPTMRQARDGVLAAALASTDSGADVADVWAGFAARGMGFGSENPTGNTVIENFDLPNAVLGNPFSVSDAPGDGDGFPEPGENLLLTVAVTNNTGNTVNNVTASVTGGGSANYGTIAHGDTVTRDIAYQVPANAECGSMHTVSISVSSALGSQAARTREFRLGAPVGGAAVTFENTTAMTIPTTAGTATPYTTSVNVSGLTGNKIVRLELTGFTHTFPSDMDFLLVGPGGQKFIPMSDVGGSADVSNINITMTDTSTTIFPATLITGTFQARNVGANDPFTAPAPAGPYGNPPTGGTDTFASIFGTSGATLNGEWKLFVVDDANTDGGSLAGWKLTFEANDYACTLAPSGSTRADFDGDGKTDMSVYRPGEGNWYLNRSSAGFTAVNFGNSTDVLAPGDYDGDGKTDVAVYRGGNWFALNSATNTFESVSFGLASDAMVNGDYDGDGKTDRAVFRSSNNTWYVMKSSGGIQSGVFGQAGDVPVVGDFDGDGKSDYTVFRAGNWFTQKSTGGVAVTPFGLATDKPVPADYDGDGKDDVAVYRNGSWFILRSSDGQFTSVSFGLASDVPVPGDYDGDGKYDVAVFRGGAWYILGSTSGFSSASFGVASDRAVPKSYIP